jgi:hypothetical protein
LISLNLIDTTFRHHPNCSVAGRSQTEIKWNREHFLPGAPTVVTDQSLLSSSLSQLGTNVIAWTLESSAIQPKAIENLLALAANYQLVLTHNSQILEAHNNSRFVPGGGVWIGGSHAGGEVSINEKKILVSIISSKKMYTPLHRFRLAAALEARTFFPDVSVSIGSRRVISWELLKNHAFNVAIENYVDDHYFTEKILNCFATGTIPIYRGARNIDNYFNSDGIITFNSLSELRKILAKLDFKEYEDRFAAIKDNFNRVKNYLTIEQYIYNNYGREICSL